MRSYVLVSVVLAVGSIFHGMLTDSLVLADSDSELRLILDGVRASRLALREGSVTIRVTDELRRIGETESYTIKAEWKDDSLRFLETHPDGSFRRCSIRHDDEILFRQKNYGGAAHGGGVRDLDAGYKHFLFDPRLLGASPWLHPGQTASYSLFSPEFKWKCTLRNASDRIDDSDCIVIRWGADGFIQNYWVDIDNGFRVRRIVDVNSRSEFLCSYSGSCVLPRRVVMISTDREKSVIRRTVFEVSEVDLAPVGDSSFSMAGLGLEIGEPMIDERLQRIIGFWNGRDLSESLADAVAVASSLEPPPREHRRWVALTIGVFVLLVVMIIVHRGSFVRPASGS